MEASCPPPPPGSIVNGEPVTAYNLKTRLPNRPMRVMSIYRYLPRFEDGKCRYRLCGIDAETYDDMSKFCNGLYAEQVSDQLNIQMIDINPNTNPV